MNACGGDTHLGPQSRGPSGGPDPRAGRGRRPPGPRLDGRPCPPIGTAAAPTAAHTSTDGGGGGGGRVNQLLLNRTRF